MFDRYDTYAVIDNKNLSAALEDGQDIYGGVNYGNRLSSSR